MPHDLKQWEATRNEVVREGFMEEWELAYAFQCMDVWINRGRRKSKHKD